MSDGELVDCGLRRILQLSYEESAFIAPAMPSEDLRDNYGIGNC